MTDIRVEVDGIPQPLVFPEGTSEAVIDKAVKDLLAERASVLPEGERASADSRTEAAMIGMGRGFDLLQSNAKEAGNLIFGRPGLAAIEAAKQDEIEQLAKGVKEDFPISSALGEAATTAFIPGKLPVQMGIGGVEGALRGDTAGERAINAIFGIGGAFAGQKFGDMIGARFQNFLAKMTGAEGAEAAGRLLDQGVTMRPSQRPFLGVPGFSRSPMARFTDFLNGIITGNRLPGQAANTRFLDRQALAAVGVRGSNVTREALGEAHTNIQKVYQHIADNVDNVGFDDAAIQRLSQVSELAETAEAQGALIRRHFNNILDSATGGKPMSGQRWNQIRNKLNSAVRSAWRTGDENSAEAASELIEIMDDALEVAAPELSATLPDARNKWRLLRVLRRAATTSPDGHINEASMMNAFDAAYPGASVGKFPLGPQGQFGQNLADIRSLAIPRQTSNTAENIARFAGATTLAGLPFIPGGAIPAAGTAGVLATLAFGGGGTGGLLGGAAGRGAGLFGAEQVTEKPSIFNQ